MTKELPVINPTNSTFEGDLTLEDVKPKLGEAEIVVEKILQKYELVDGEIGKKIDIDTNGWEIVNDGDFEITLKQKRNVKMKFIREPKAVHEFIQLSKVIYSVLFEAEGNEMKQKVLGYKLIIQDEIHRWIQVASSLTLAENEQVDLDSAIKYFVYYMQNNSSLNKQTLIFLARPDKG